VDEVEFGLRLPAPASLDDWLRPLLLNARFIESINLDPSDRLEVKVGGVNSSAFFF
jgi:hypothetical protein